MNPAPREELLQLTERADALSSDPPGLATFVEIIGEAGSGRTHLLEEFRPHLDGEGWVTFWVEAYPGRGSARRSLPDLASQLIQGLSPRSRPG